MHLANDSLKKVLAHWFEPFSSTSLEIREIAGGLSGARLWRVAIDNEAFCLRRWPDICLSAYELGQIHGLITHLWSEGLRTVPFPHRTCENLTFVNADGRMWELADWLPGETVEQPTIEQTVEAMKTLARFHQHAVSYADPKIGIAPGLQMRVSLLAQLHQGHLSYLNQSVSASQPTDLRELAMPIVKGIGAVLPSVLATVEHAASVNLPLQWCLRDIHKGNLLFSGNNVSGLVDFGAAAIDSVAGDVARLGGSLAGNDPQIWRTCIAAYTELRHLSADEQQVILAYDTGGVVAAAANWLRWLFVEGRDFADAATTQERLTDLSNRLKLLIRGPGLSL